MVIRAKRRPPEIQNFFDSFLAVGSIACQVVLGGSESVAAICAYASGLDFPSWSQTR